MPELYGKVEVCQESGGSFPVKKVRFDFDPPTDAGFVNFRVGHGHGSININGIGKALRPIMYGKGLIPILVALQ